METARDTFHNRNVAHGQQGMANALELDQHAMETVANEAGCIAHTANVVVTANETVVRRQRRTLPRIVRRLLNIMLQRNTIGVPRHGQKTIRMSG